MGIELSTNYTALSSNNIAAGEIYSTYIKIVVKNSPNYYRYRYVIEKNSYEEFDEDSWEPVKTFETSEPYLSINDIREYVWSASVNYYYRIEVTGYKMLAGFETGYSNKFVVTKAPTLKGLYTKRYGTSFSNMAGFYENSNFTSYYSNSLWFHFDYDQGYDQMRFRDYTGASKTIKLSKLRTSKGITVLVGEFNDSTTSSKCILNNSTISFLYNGKTFTTSNKFSVYKIATPTFSSVTFTGLEPEKEYKVFTNMDDEKNIAITFDLSWESGAEEEKKLLQIGTKDKLNFQYRIWLDEKMEFFSDLKTDETTTSMYHSELSINFPTLSTNTCNVSDSTQRNALIPAEIELFLSRDLGNDVLIGSFPFKADFREQVITEGHTQTITNNSTDLSEVSYLREGSNLSGNFSFKSYNTNPIIEILQQKVDGTWTIIATKNASLFDSNDETSEAKPGAPLEYSYDGYIATLGSFSEDQKANFKIRINTDAGPECASEPKLYQNIQIKRYIAPTLEIIKAYYSDKKLSVNYKIKDAGFDDTGNLQLLGKIKLVLKNKDESITSEDNPTFTTSEQTANFVFEFDEGEEAVNIALQITTKIDTDINKTGTSPFYTVYNNLIPTVAYRKNHLGINTFNPSSEGHEKAIIVIGETSNRNEIHFQSANNNYCIIKGFVIDGGSWDGSSGGIIPGGGGTLPTGLAAIAYTGEVKDLVQNEQNSIIITGGNS